MLFTTKTEYGVRALVCLAAWGKTQPVSLPIIAREIGVSQSYLEQLFSRLKKAGLITSVKGAEGGYQLADAPSKINLLSIVKVLEGDIAINDCLSKSGKACSGHCLTRRVWQEVQSSVESKLKSIKLSQLI